MKHNKIIQLVWGLLLIMMGIAVIIKTHIVFPIAEGLTFRQIALYILSVMLIGVGIKKNYLLFYKKDKS
ncbi:MAG: hypothetical protein ABIF87_14065 [Pseudomonadota bacterium]